MPAASRRSRGARSGRWWMATTKARGPRTGATSSRSPAVATICAVRVLQQALATQQAYLVQMRGDVRTELLSVQQQLVAVQELTCHSQPRLTELRSRIESRAQQPDPGMPATGGAP